MKCLSVHILIILQKVGATTKENIILGRNEWGLQNNNVNKNVNKTGNKIDAHSTAIKGG